ncbi:Cna B-type domain-containing protein [Boudabousia marimammalium]|uniref:Prealbumin-like fold domain-containing protein n=1 Tax=Boudabousia marimammalium TaxID=156892 RepID=A0A1Q5PL30_9ACTO|nr:Cna B-type domain-containing protein [Boudabousia marimammalium]OKL47345.1 hypothetical protein BM477_06665 [Boudabousia marimammalium]
MRLLSDSLIKKSKVLASIGIVVALCAAGSVPVQAAERPFPKYDLSFQWIHGEADPQWKPGDPGDGCLRSENPTVTHLSTFGFRTVLNPCDGVRTTMRWYYDDTQTGASAAPTNMFRLGVTWQHTRRDSNDPYVWKPVENMTMDGQKIDPNLYDPANQESVVVKKANGDWSHIPDRPTGFFEPKHVVFDDFFEFNEEHTFVWDSYLPVFADGGGMSIGTGSTGDTQGGSIGAKANGLYVSIPAYADFRYVLDTEYRQAMSVPGTDATGVAPKLPHRPLAKWSGPVEGSTYTTIQCLESADQFLAPVVTGKKTADVYPELAKKYPSVANSAGSVQIADGSGSYGLARWPYEFSLKQPGTWASAAGLRPFNYDSAAEKFLDYGDKNLPYKPTFESVKKEIPGYTYVDNDLPIDESGAFDKMGSGGIPTFKAAPNIRLSYHKTVGYETQHLYFTYKKTPGTFKLKKTSPDGKPIQGAKFALYQVVNDKVSPCGVKPDMTGVESLKVCELRTPQSTAEAIQMLESEPTGCEQVQARQVKLPEFDSADGTFVTDATGGYTPSGAPALEPGQYLLKEISAPEPYRILNQFTDFEIPLQAGTNDKGVLVPMQIPGVANVLNYPDMVIIPVSKTWNDKDDAAQVRPDSVEIELLADGAPTGKILRLTAKNGWSGTFEALKKAEDGHVIEYSVKEKTIPAYESQISGTTKYGFLVTNTYKPTPPPTPTTVPTPVPTPSSVEPPVPGGGLSQTGLDLFPGMVAVLALLTGGLLLVGGRQKQQ